MPRPQPLDPHHLAKLSPRERGRALQRHLAEVLLAAANGDGDPVSDPPPLMTVSQARRRPFVRRSA